MHGHMNVKLVQSGSLGSAFWETLLPAKDGSSISLQNVSPYLSDYGITSQDTSSLLELVQDRQ